jgi:hypothetical protein
MVGAQRVGAQRKQSAQRVDRTQCDLRAMVQAGQVPSHPELG